MTLGSEEGMEGLYPTGISFYIMNPNHSIPTCILKYNNKMNIICEIRLGASSAVLRSAMIRSMGNFWIGIVYSENTHPHDRTTCFREMFSAEYTFKI